MRRVRGLAGRDAALVATLSTLSALSLVGTALAPALLRDHSLLVIALAPRYPFLAVAAARVPLVPFAAVAFLRLVVADAPNFVLARRHGTRLGAAAARWRATDALHRGLTAVFARLGVVAVACSPTGRVLALAGASGVRPRRVAAADCLGTAVQIGVLWAAAHRLT